MQRFSAARWPPFEHVHVKCDLLRGLDDVGDVDMHDLLRSWCTLRLLDVTVMFFLVGGVLH